MGMGTESGFSPKRVYQGILVVMEPFHASCVNLRILVVVLYYTTVLQDVTPGKVWIKGTLYFAVLFLTIANKKFN